MKYLMIHLNSIDINTYKLNACKSIVYNFNPKIVLFYYYDYLISISIFENGLNYISELVYSEIMYNNLI